MRPIATPPGSDALADPARLAALRSTALLDSPPEEAFDRLTRLASRVLRAPVALVSLVDADRQFFKSQVGLPEPWASRRGTPLSHSFCQQVVASGAPLRVEDAPADRLVRDNQAIADLGVIAYLGMPLRTSAGQVLGSFCAIDTRPRAWTEEEAATLRDLAGAAMTEIELRALARDAREQAEIHAHLSTALRRTAEQAESQAWLARRSAERTARLQRVTAALAEAATPAEVAAAVVDDGLRALGAQAGLLAVVEADGAVQLVLSQGYPEDLADAWRAGRLATPHLVAEVARTGRSVWVGSAEEMLARYPGYGRLQDRLAFGGRGGVPLQIEGRTIGVLGFSYAEPRPFPPEDREFAETLGRLAAQTLERAQLYAAADADRRRLEQEAAERARSEARFAAIVDQALVGICQADLSGRIVLANDRFCEMVGRRRELLLGLRMQDITHPDDRLASVTLFGALASGGPAAVVEKRYVRPDGVVVWVRNHVSSVRDATGRPQLVLAVAHDVTAERRAAQRAARLHALTADLARAATPAEVAAAVLTHGAAALGANAGSVALLQADGDLVVVGSVGAVPVPPEWRRFGLDAPLPVAEAVRTGSVVVAARGERNARYPVFAAQLAARAGDGAAVAAPLADGDRVVGGLVLLLQEDRAFDADDRAFLATLVGQCGQALRRAELHAAEQQARARAEAAVRARDEFLSIAAHELRTPVTSIKGSVQLLALARARGQLTDERLDRFVRGGVEAADRLAGLVEDVLDVSRLRTGRLPVHPRAIDLGELARRVVAERGDPPAGLRIEVATEPGIAVSADPERLAQVLGNLLDNAVKYSPGGGLVAVTVAAVDDEAVVGVSDQGIGLPAGADQAIFEPFGRATNAVERRLPGIGLGLYVSRAIVEQHGGRMWAESPGEDRGTAVSFALPRHREEPAPGG